MKHFRMTIFIGLALMLVSTSLPAYWEKMNGPFFESRTYALAFGVSGNDTILYTGSNEGAIYSTKDKGKTWVRLGGKPGTFGTADTGITRSPIIILATAPNGSGGMCLFAVDGSGGLFRSLKADTAWVKLNDVLDNHTVSAFMIDDTVCYAGTGSGIYRSTDRGSTWTTDQNELANVPIVSLAAIHTGAGRMDLLAETPIGLYRSADHGSSWTSVNALAKDYRGFVSGTTLDGKDCLYAVSGGSIVKSLDEGSTWTRLYFYSFASANCVAAADTVLFAGTISDGVLVSRDGGATWRPKSFGDPSGAYALLIVGHDLLASFDSHISSTTSVWYQQLSQLLTAVHQPDEHSPATFGLDQNYPNPFNPSTTISFSIPSKSHVSLNIYDMMGRSVETIVSGQLPAGSYQYQWDATGMPSGMYFYRLQAESYTETKRLILVK